MRVPQVLNLLGLAHAASAINVSFWFSGDCFTPNPTLQCARLPRDTCCVYNRDPVGGARRVAFTQLESNRDWWLLAYRGGSCSILTDQTTSRGRSNVCMVNGGPYNGAGWGARPARRGGVEPVVETAEDVCAAGAVCRKSQAPDLLVLGDGTEFNIADMETAARDELIDLAIDGANSTTVPEWFASFRR